MFTIHMPIARRTRYQIYRYFFRAGRASYREEAVGYVQVKHEGSKCTVKCRVSPEHKVKSKPYHCTLVCDKNEGMVESIVCHDCAANQGGCKHTF